MNNIIIIYGIDKLYFRSNYMNNNNALANCAKLHQKLFIDSKEALVNRILEKIEWKTTSTQLSPSIIKEELKNKVKEKLLQELSTELDEKRIEAGMKIIADNLHYLPNEKHCLEELNEALERI